MGRRNYRYFFSFIVSTASLSLVVRQAASRRGLRPDAATTTTRAEKKLSDDDTPFSQVGGAACLRLTSSDVARSFVASTRCPRLADLWQLAPNFLFRFFLLLFFFSFKREEKKTAELGRDKMFETLF